MGLSSEFAAISGGAIAHATAWLGDFAVVIVLFASVAVLGLVLATMRRFL